MYLGRSNLHKLCCSWRFLVSQRIPLRGGLTTVLVDACRVPLAWPTPPQLFMFLSSIFNGIIVLEHGLMFALNKWVGERAELVLRIKKLQRNVRMVRHAVRLQRAFRNHRIDVMHQQILAESSSDFGDGAYLRWCLQLPSARSAALQLHVGRVDFALAACCPRLAFLAGVLVHRDFYDGARCCLKKRRTA